MTDRPGLWADVRDAVTPRTFALVVGVLVLQLAFILSYVGAFHGPKPHRIEVAVVAPASQAATIAKRLDALAGAPLSARVVDSESKARRQVRRGDVSAALVVDPRSSTDHLLVASGGGAGVATAVEAALTRVEQSQSRTLRTTDLVPLQGGDARGLTGFYLVIGWLVGGYLVASLLGVSRGARPATVRRAAIRLGSLVPYAIVSGLGGAVIVGPVLHALDGHLVTLWWIGALVVFAAAAATAALEILFGVIGIGVAVLVFVVLGNPSAGGAFQLELLPPFWRAIGNALPNGAATDAVRRVVYLGGNGIALHLVVIAIWAVAGVIVALAGAGMLPRRGTAASDDQPAAA